MPIFWVLFKEAPGGTASWCSSQVMTCIVLKGFRIGSGQYVVSWPGEITRESHGQEAPFGGL